MCNTLTFKMRFASSAGMFFLLITMLPLGQSVASGSLPKLVVSGSHRITVSSGISARFAPPAASFPEVWLEHHVRMRGRNGMVIHSHIMVTDRVKIKCRVEAYFYDATNNKQIPAAPGSPNSSSGGTAAVWRDIKPGYPSTEY